MVPGLAKQTSTPAAAAVPTRLSAPFMRRRTLPARPGAGQPSFSMSRFRARYSRLITVPSGTFSTSAVSL